MPRFPAKRAVDFFIRAVVGGLIVCSGNAASALEIEDAISSPCTPVAEFRGDVREWQSRRFPEWIKVDIAPSKQKKWIEGLLRTLTSRKRNISPAARKKFKANVSWEIDGYQCSGPAEVRLNGDAKDHISYSGSAVIASVVVKLLEGHIGNAVRFKLLLPETRVGDREILAILLFREFGFVAPESRMVTGYLNGIKTPYIFQESPAKEFMEANGLRESLLVEGDERWGWLMHSKPDVYSEKLVHDAVWVENRSFGRADNKSWIDNPVATNIAVTGLSIASPLYHQYHTDKPDRVNDEDHLGMTSSYRLRQNSEVIENESLYVLLAKVTYASHGLRLHNRKFYYDATYQKLKPIYYDGMALRDRDNRLGRFPRQHTFPEDEISLVVSKLANSEVRNRLFSGLSKRGGTMTRSVFDDLINTVLARAKALKPRPTESAAEPPPVQTLNLPLLLSEELGNYEFFGLNAKTGAFQHCVATKSDTERASLTCTNTSATPKMILAEPVSKNGDPIPFIGAFTRHDSNIVDFSTRSGFKQFVKTNPQSLDLQIAADELYIIDFTDEYSSEEAPSIKANIATSGTLSGRIVVRGNMPPGATFEIVGDGAGMVGLTRYDQRLLTGCLTFLDASFSGLHVTSKQSSCEDGVNFVRSHGRISKLLVEYSIADAVDADFSNLDFDSIQITHAGNDCIDLSSGHYRITDLHALDCGDKGLSIGEKAVVLVDELTVTGAVIGAVAKDSSYLSVKSTSLDSVQRCFAAYRKKQEFDGARIALSGAVPGFCTDDRMVSQSGSEIDILAR